MLLLTALLIAATPPLVPAELEKLAATLRGAPAWRAEFVQTYTPAGFDEGTTDAGSLTLAPPDRLRFEYRGESGRVFALDGVVIRNVEENAGTCDAVRLDERMWGRLPLAALLDPTAAVASFSTEVTSGTLRLVPRQLNPDVASIEVAFATSNLVEKVTVTDPSGNRNVFSFSGWKAIGAQSDAVFHPALHGRPPCQPEGS
jgi:hypothetical protein